jgi:hypothetical protein
MAPQVGLESTAKRSLMHLERGRWHLTRLITHSSVLMAREQNFRVEMGERETGPVNLDHFSRRVLSHYVST